MFPLVHLGVDFFTTDQVPPFGGGVALFDLVAIPSDPRVAVAEQFQCPAIPADKKNLTPADVCAKVA